MSILDKHPAPWRFDTDLINWVDANGYAVPDEPAARLIDASAELAAALRECVGGWLELHGTKETLSQSMANARALIERIEKGT